MYCITCYGTRLGHTLLSSVYAKSTYATAIAKRAQMVFEMGKGEDAPDTSEAGGLEVGPAGETVGAGVTTVMAVVVLADGKEGRVVGAEALAMPVALIWGKAVIKTGRPSSGLGDMLMEGEPVTL